MDVKVRVHGISHVMRELARANKEEEIALRRGVHESAEFLMGKIKEKFGVYQPNGGSGGGPWKQLTFETNMKKLRKWGFTNKPLLGSGALRDSLYIKDTNGKSIMSSVASNSPYMVYHVYGAPARNLPPRDAMLVSAEQYKDDCRKIILDNIYSAYR